MAVLTRGSSSFDPRITVITGDLRDPESLQGKLDQITKVIHLAAATHARSKSEYYQANATGTQNLIKALPRQIDQFVYVSTNCAVPGAGWYGESKRAAEEMVKRHFENYVLLRVADVYGGEGEKSLEKLINQVTTWPFFPLVGAGDQQMAPVHVEDVMSAIAGSCDLAGQHELVVSGVNILTFKQLVTEIGNLAGKTIKTVHVPPALLELLIVLLSKAGIGDFYPDQVKRLTAVKPLDSRETWNLLSIQPKSFEEWLKHQVTQA